MFKKQVLVLAMMALASGAALADNEAEISQDSTAAQSLATIEQNTLGDNAVTGQLTGSYGQVIQSNTVQSTAQLYQSADPANDAAILDVSAGTPTSVSILAQTVTLPVDPLAYVAQMGVLGSTATNVGVVAQFNTVNAQASILQLTGAEDTTFAAGIIYSTGVGLVNGGNAASGDVSTGGAIPLGITAAPATTVTYAAGANTYADTFLTTAVTIGTGAGGGANTNNLAVIDQGDVPVDRAGNILDGGANSWNVGGIASYDDQSQIIQSGVGNTAVAIQAGDAQVSSIYQDGLNNDAYIVQFGNAGIASGANDTTADPLSNFAAIVQLASADVATIEQGGTQNTAYILQH